MNSLNNSCYPSFLNSSNDINFMSNVGQMNDQDPNLVYLLSFENINTMSQQITKALDGVDPLGRKIIISPEQIASMVSSVYRFGTRPNIGDIHSRYIIPPSQSRCDIRSIINQTLNIIITQIRDQVEMETNNKKLTIWTTLLGDFNSHGLRSHAPLKIKHKHPQYMAFNMNY